MDSPRPRLGRDKHPERWRARELFKPPFKRDLLWLLLPIALIFLYLGLLPLRAWDYWWHITVGRLVDHYGSVPDANHFLYTMEASAPSFIQPWLSQWLLFWVHDFGGLSLALLARNLILTALFGWLGLEASRRSRSALVGGLIILGCFALSASYFDAGGDLFILPLFSILIWLSYKIRAGRAPLFLLIIYPLTTALWANLHGSFLVPGALCATFGAAALLERFDPRRAREDTSKPPASTKNILAWAAALMLTLLAPLLNPRGAELFSHLRELATSTEGQAAATYWSAILSHPPALSVLLYAALLAGALLLWRRRKTADLADIILFAAFALLAIMTSRGVIFFSLIIPWTIAPYLSRREPAAKSTRPSTWQSALNLVVILGAFSAGFLLQPGLKTQRAFIDAYNPMGARLEAPMAGLVDAKTPVMSTAILSQFPGPIRVFHDEKYAGYLLFHLTKYQPQQIVFVDERLELPSPDIWKLYHAAAETSAWKGIFQQFEIEAALLDKARQPRLLEAMLEEPGWELRYEDDYNALLMQRR